MTQPEILYYNLSFTCKKNNQTDPDVIAQFKQGRSQMILHNASDYYYTVVRFTMNSSNLPILIPPIATGQSNVDLTTWGMVLQYNNVFSDATFINYTCRNKYFNNPVNPPTIQQDDNPYYYIQNIAHFVDMFNDCASRCFTNLASKDGVTLTGKAPKLKYNGDNTFSIYYDNSIFTDDNTLNLLFNNNLYNVLRNFNYSTVANSNGFNYKLMITDKIDNYTTVGSVDYIFDKQVYPSMDNWSPVQNISFVTSNDIHNELFASPVFVSNNDINSVYVGNADSTDNIATDIILPVDNPEDYNSYIVYNATVYRETVITTDRIGTIEFTVKWKNRLTGKIYNVLLSDGDSVSAKIKFQKYK